MHCDKAPENLGADMTGLRKISKELLSVGILFLLMWSVYGICNLIINQVSLNVIPMILLLLQIVIFGVANYLMEVENKALKAFRISWIFGIMFLFAWLLYEVYSTFTPNLFVLTLLSLHMIIFQLSYTILENKMKKEPTKEHSLAELKGIKISWIFGMVFLLAWSIYEIYNTFINHVSVNPIPLILLLLQASIYKILCSVLDGSNIKAIRISWMFGVMFLLVYPLHDIRMDITIFNVLLLLQSAIFGLSYFIFDIKAKKGTHEERPLIKQVGRVVLTMVIVLLLANFIAIFLIGRF